jgi:hypothetical protein
VRAHPFYDAESPAAVYTWALGHARGLSTWRLRRLEARARRRAEGLVTAQQLATLAAVRAVLLERGVDLPDAGERPSWRAAVVSGARLAAGIAAVAVLVAIVVASVIAAVTGAGLDVRGGGS